MKTKIIILSILIFLVSGTILVKGKVAKNNMFADHLYSYRNDIINNDTNVTYEINSNEYTYKLNGNNVLIKYPVLISDKFDFTIINDTIKETALNIFSIDKEVNQEINIEYEVTFSNNSFISIVFKGLINATSSAHPSNIFYTLNINIENSSKIRLTDIYNIDDDFVEICRNELKKQLDSNIAIYLDNELKDMLINSDQKSEVYSYYKEKSVGISFPTIHVIGDHSEIEISKELLKNNLK